MLIFLLLFWRALRKREQLDLELRESHLTKVSIGAAAIEALAAGVSLAMVLLGGETFGGWAGVIYPATIGARIYDLLQHNGRKSAPPARLSRALSRMEMFPK